MGTYLMRQPHFLQQIRFNRGAEEVAAFVKVHLNVLAKPAAVVVANGPGVPKGFEDGVGLEDLGGWVGGWVEEENAV